MITIFLSQVRKQKQWEVKSLAQSTLELPIAGQV